MKMYKCPNCGKMNTAMYCDTCDKSIPAIYAVDDGAPQKSYHTYEKKQSGKGRIIAIIASVCAVVAIAVVIIVNLGISPAERIAVSFMDAFKKEDYSSMKSFCDIYAFDDEEYGIFSFSGTNIIDYKIKSVSAPHKVEKRWIQNNYGDFDKFLRYREDEKRAAEYRCEEIGCSAVIEEDSTEKFVIKTSEKILDEYYVTLDVQYSTILGNTKRNSATITVRQKDIDSKEYVITDVIGIIH